MPKLECFNQRGNHSIHVELGAFLCLEFDAPALEAQCIQLLPEILPLAVVRMTAPATMPPHVSADLFDVWRRLSPRRTLRIDIDGSHEYVAQHWSRHPSAPEAPYAVYLADRRGQYRFVCLDLDLSRGDVHHDHSVLLELLDEAGAQSSLSVFSYDIAGPDGGRHVWLHLTDGGVPAETMATLVDALKPVLPSLDYGMLLNPASGAARPPGAPHRRGGHATIDHFVHRDGPAEAMRVFTAGDSPDLVNRLFDVLGASKFASVPASQNTGNNASGFVEAPAPRAAKRRQTRSDDGARRLDRPRRDLSPTVWASAAETPDHGDTSRSTYSVCIGAILAGWRRHDVADLATNNTLPGLEHLRSKTAGPGPRIRLSPGEAADRLARQWDRAFAFVDTLPAVDRDHALQEPSDGIDAACDAIAKRMADEAHRWATGGGMGYRGGPADKQVMRLLLTLAGEARSLEIDLDVRRGADRTGLGKSTVDRALARLADTTDPFRGEPWIELVKAGEGRTASTYRLLIPAKTESVDASGTQGTPTPRAAGPAAPQVPVAALREHLRLLAHDVWTAHGGLGHECGETYTAVVTKNDPPTVQELAQTTTYTLATTHRHLHRLSELDLVQLHRDDQGSLRVQVGDATFDDAAQTLGTAGTGARRREQHDIERALWSWWNAELDWRTSPATTKPAGVAEDIVPKYAPDTLRWRFGRFPTVPGGRADFTAARDRVTKVLSA